MENAALGETAKTRKVVFHRVAENLYRLESSGGYYALLKRADKQFRRSLRTKDRRLAERRLAELRSQVGQLRMTEDAFLSFNAIAERWMAATQHTLKASTITRRKTCIANVAHFFRGQTIRNIRPQHCEKWLTERGANLAPQTMAHELNAMRSIFEYATSIGVILSNPARLIRRKKIVQAPIDIPSKTQFRDLVRAIRESDGKLSNQIKSQPGADLVELLAYSGCRLNEALSLRWEDVDFETNVLRITGGDRGTKNGEHRIIPMTKSLHILLLRLRHQRNAGPHDAISEIGSAKKCIQTACRRLKFPRYTHHDFRHFFATSCIEAGVDIPTVSRWLGHKDGGALAMKVYGHLRDAHSHASALKVDF